MTPPTPPELSLDHVSLRTWALDETLAVLEERLGLVATRTPQAPKAHARIHLEGAYLEVSTAWNTTPASPLPAGALPPLSAPYFFLKRPEALTAGALRARGLQAKAPQRYEGVDGVWEDQGFEDPEGERLLLVRRTEPPELAQSWPPPLAHRGPAGIGSLEAVVLTTPALAQTVRFFENLVGAAAVLAPRRDEALGGLRVDVQLTRGNVMLLEGNGYAVEGVVLGVAEVSTAKAYVTSKGVRLADVGGEVLWVEDGLPGPLRWGLRAR